MACGNNSQFKDGYNDKLVSRKGPYTSIDNIIGMIRATACELYFFHPLLNPTDLVMVITLYNSCMRIFKEVCYYIISLPIRSACFNISLFKVDTDF